MPSGLRERFGVIDQLGRGSYGTVFQVVDRESLQRFALKVTIAAPDAMLRAGREVEAVASLAHENILPAIDYEALGAWFILPLADGPLGQMRAWGRAGPGTALEIAISVGRALEHAHGLGFLHRDLHVDNILRCDGKWMVGDWGLAVGPRSDPLTRTRSVGGTETWTAPEQLASLRSADARSDLFSLGRIVQWLVTGALPDISRAASLPVGEPLAAFVNACTQLSPDARPATVRAAMDLLPRQPIERAAPVAPAASRASPRPLRASVPPATLERVLGTHRARLAQVQGGQTPVALEPRPTFVLHVLPLEDTGNFDLLPLKVASVDLMPRVAHVHWLVRFNHDGLLGYWPDEAPVSQYVQVLRSGGIELVDTYGVQRIHAPKPVLFPLSLERDVVAFIRHWNETVLEPLGVSLPRVACLSITGIKGFVLHIDERPSFLPKPLFDRDTVSFRPVVLDAAEDVEQSLKPMFDALWRAAGEDRSLGYSSAGSWIPDAHKRA